MNCNKVCILILIMIVLWGCNNENEEFRLEDYAEFIKNSDYKYSRIIKKKTIDNDNQAKKLAESIWMDLYGNAINKQKPYIVLRDDKEKVWLVHGTMKKKHIGGVAYIIINDEGEVLAVWHEK